MLTAQFRKTSHCQIKQEKKINFNTKLIPTAIFSTLCNWLQISFLNLINIVIQFCFSLWTVFPHLWFNSIAKCQPAAAHHDRYQNKREYLVILTPNWLKKKRSYLWSAQGGCDRTTSTFWKLTDVSLNPKVKSKLLPRASDCFTLFLLWVPWGRAVKLQRDFLFCFCFLTVCIWGGQGYCEFRQALEWSAKTSLTGLRPGMP